MSIHVNIGGINKGMSDGWANINGVWKKIDSVYNNIGGAWKEGHSSGKYVVLVGANVYTSSNLTSWTLVHTIPYSDQFGTYILTYNKSSNVFMASNTKKPSIGSRYSISKDGGQTWVDPTITGFSRMNSTFGSLSCFDESYFVVFTTGQATGGTYYYYISENGEDWTLYSYKPSYAVYGAWRIGNAFVVEYTGGSNTRYYYYNNGSSWYPIASVVSASAYPSYANGVSYLSLGNAHDSSRTFYSTNPKGGWTEMMSGGNYSYTFAYANGVYVRKSSYHGDTRSQSLQVSTTGISGWVEANGYSGLTNGSQLFGAGGYFIATAPALGGTVYTSVNGSDWQTFVTGLPGRPSAMYYVE